MGVVTAATKTVLSFSRPRSLCSVLCQAGGCRGFLGGGAPCLRALVGGRVVPAVDTCRF